MTERDDTRLVDYLYGELPKEEAEAFERALREDPESEVEARGLGDVLNTMRALEEEAPPPHLDALILARARETAQAAAEQGTWAKIRKLFASPIAGLVTAGSLAAVLAVIALPTQKAARDSSLEPAAPFAAGAPAPAVALEEAPAAGDAPAAADPTPPSSETVLAQPRDGDEGALGGARALAKQDAKREQPKGGAKLSRGGEAAGRGRLDDGIIGFGPGSGEGSGLGSGSGRSASGLGGGGGTRSPASGGIVATPPVAPAEQAQPGSSKDQRASAKAPEQKAKVLEELAAAGAERDEAPEPAKKSRSTASGKAEAPGDALGTDKAAEKESAAAADSASAEGESFEVARAERRKQPAPSAAPEPAASAPAATPPAAPPPPAAKPAPPPRRAEPTTAAPRTNVALDDESYDAERLDREAIATRIETQAIQLSDSLKRTGDMDGARRAIEVARQKAPRGTVARARLTVRLAKMELERSRWDTAIAYANEAALTDNAAVRSDALEVARTARQRREAARQRPAAASDDAH